MKFIADAMLGKLAKRLRLMGVDVLYDTAWDDNDLIRISLHQDRQLLTRDRVLASRPLVSAHCLLISGDQVQEQLQQTVGTFAIAAAPFTRCSRCNEPLRNVALENTADRIPDQVRSKYPQFYECRICGRIYWAGTHVARMKLSDHWLLPGIISSRFLR